MFTPIQQMIEATNHVAKEIAKARKRVLKSKENATKKLARQRVKQEEADMKKKAETLQKELRDAVKVASSVKGPKATIHNVLEDMNAELTGCWSCTNAELTLEKIQKM
eukprot:2258393-Karenia_brevis.AAC.1